MKKTFEYTAVFKKAEEGGYDVTFPSLPGCLTFGKNLKDAQRYAQEVLELWLWELQDKKALIPADKNPYNKYIVKMKATLKK